MRFQTLLYDEDAGSGGELDCVHGNASGSPMRIRLIPGIKCRTLHKSVTGVPQFVRWVALVPLTALLAVVVADDPEE